MQLADTKPTKPAIKSSTLPRMSSQGKFYQLLLTSVAHFFSLLYRWQMSYYSNTNNLFKFFFGKQKKAAIRQGAHPEKLFN